MSVEAKLRYSRISPRKVRLVADLIRGLQVDEAEKVLQFTIKKSADPILKVLRSAVANAEHNFSLKRTNLYISEIKVDGGPIIKRYRPRARGVAFPIQKKTSHITIKIAEKGGKEQEKKKKQAKIEKVYQEEKPKEEVVRQKAGHKDEGQAKEKINKETRGDKKQIFRRKSI
jgi:large subunit ribosomal protein L22